MPWRYALLLSLILSAGLWSLAGCRAPDPQLQAAGDSDLPGQPVPAGQSGDRGMFLRTGAIQLGPGVGRNLWRWQGDGEGGF
jgi:hypothetical protein